MPTLDEIKAYFEANDRPTQSQFAEAIEKLAEGSNRGELAAHPSPSDTDYRPRDWYKLTTDGAIYQLGSDLTPSMLFNPQATADLAAAASAAATAAQASADAAQTTANVADGKADANTTAIATTATAAANAQTTADGAVTDAAAAQATADTANSKADTNSAGILVRRKFRPNIASLQATAGVDGESETVLGYSTPGDAGDPKDWTYHATGRSGITVDVFNIAGPGADDWWELAEQDTVDARWAGCVANWVYPFTGTDSTAAFNAFFAHSATTKIIPPGAYRITDTITVPVGCNIIATGASLNCTQAGRTDRHILHLTGSFGGRTLKLPSIQGYILPQRIPYGDELNAAIAITGPTTNCDIYLQSLRRHPIGFLAQPQSGVAFFAYNRIYGGAMTGVRVGIELRGEANSSETGWANENSFYGPNLTFTSDSNTLGSLFGVKVSTDPSNGYSGQNNNRFYSPCFQVGGYSEGTHKLTVGKAVTLHQRYVNRDVDLGNASYGEYVCTAVGSGGVATVPTHTTVGQDVVDGNGYGFTYAGKWWRTPVYFDRAGGRNTFHGCRWEGGDGPFALIERAASRRDIDGNEFHVYHGTNGQSEVDRRWPAVRQLTENASDALCYGVNVRNMFSTYASRGLRRSVIRDFHKRMLYSTVTGKSTVAGCSWRDYFVVADIQTRYETRVLKLLTNGLYIPGLDSDTFGFFVRASVKQQQITLRNINEEGQEDIRTLGQFFTHDGARYQITGSTDPNFQTSMATAPNVTFDTIGTQANQGTTVHQWDTDLIDKLWLGYYAKGVLRDVEIETKDAGDGLGPIVENVWGESLFGPYVRYAPGGVPDVGYFDTVGELIVNSDYVDGSGDPIGWRVVTAGVLGEQWVTGTAYIKDQIVQNGTRCYAANDAGTSGATAPTGTGAAIDDGAVEWRYISDIAVLRPEYDGVRTATTAQLEDIADPINTDGKEPGVEVWNTDTNRTVYPHGSAAADVWGDGQGTTVHTPL